MLVFIQVAYYKIDIFFIYWKIFLFLLWSNSLTFFSFVWFEVPEYWVIQLNLIPGNWFTRENRREMWYK